MRAIWMMAALALLVGGVGSAEAGMVITIQQVGSNVDVTGSGSLNITDLTLLPGGPYNQPPDIIPFDAEAVLGAPPGGSINFYSGISGPISFGGGISASPTSGTGSIFGISASASDVVVPAGYTSGTDLGTSTDVYSGSLSSLGLTPGTYKWTWGSDLNGTADSLTVNIESPTTAVPEPASLTLLGIGAVGLIGYGWRRRRQSA